MLFEIWKQEKKNNNNNHFDFVFFPGFVSYFYALLCYSYVLFIAQNDVIVSFSLGRFPCHNIDFRYTYFYWLLN